MSAKAKAGGYMDSANYCVYIHTAPNKKNYVGITSQNPLRRWKNGFGYRKNIHFFNAIIKYGWDNFKHEILFDGLTKEEAEQKEVELISAYKSNLYQFGYNQTIGGEGVSGYEMTDEQKKARSEIASRIWEDPSRKEHYSLLMKEYWSSEKNRKRQSERQKGEKAYWFGKHLTDEAREKMSVAKKGRPALNKKHIVCVTTNEEFASLTEAAMSYKVSKSGISQVLHGKKKSIKGLIFVEVV